MADVRLTATNPDDSTVVPVACNTKGEILLESPPEFDGTLDGDLTVTGGASFASSRFNISSDGGSAIAYQGPDNATPCLDLYIPNGSTANPFIRASNGLNKVATIDSDGGATFSGRVNAGTNSAPVVGNFAIAASNNATGGTAAIFASNYAADGRLLDLRAGNNAKVLVENDGSAEFAGDVRAGDPASKSVLMNAAAGQLYIKSGVSAAVQIQAVSSPGTNQILLNSDGSADFSGEVTVTSRGSKWTLVEQGGLCHMVAATRSGLDPAFGVDDPASGVDPAFGVDDPASGVDEDPYPNLRNVFKELDMIESALQAVMEKLRMAPPAGWEVWDGST